jgi:hypothetical protein
MGRKHLNHEGGRDRVLTHHMEGLQRWTVTWPIIFLLASQHIAEAQNDWQRVINLTTGTLITVKMKTGDRYNGSFVAAVMDGLSMDSDERAHPGRITRRRDLTRSDIREVRRLQKLKSVLVGAAIGGGTGAVIGIAVDSAARSNEDKGLATAVFTLLGAVMGAMIARHTSLIKGEKIYVAP